MAPRIVVELICDECGINSGRTFKCPADADVWMRGNGWCQLNFRDWCPTCLEVPDSPDTTEPKEN